jgi:hypothetical protein
MITKTMLIRILVIAITVTAPQVAETQISAPPITNAQCATAVSDLNVGQTNGQWDILGQCGEAGTAAVVAALRAARNNTDSSYLKRLKAVASSIRHPDILLASREIALDNTAGVGARAISLMVLLAQYDKSLSLPFTLSWIKFTTVPMKSACLVYPTEDAPYAQQAAMPTDYLTTIASTADQIEHNGTEPAVLRDLASCVRTSLSHKVPRTVSPNDLTVTYVCGNKFHIANASYDAALVKYRLQTSTQTKDVSIRAGGSADVWTNVTGALVVSIDGTELPPVQNGATACT